MRPWIDYRRDLRWYTVIREPVARLVSHYLFLGRLQQFEMTFPEWLEATPPEGIANIQVRFIAGDYSVEKAKTLIEKRFISIGRQDLLHESIEHLAIVDNWDYAVLPSYRYNSSPRDSKYTEVKGQISSVKQRIQELTEADRELHRWVCDEIWPRQRQAVSRSRAERGSIVGVARNADLRRHRQHVSFRTAIYKPWVFVVRGILPKLLGSRLHR